jgi:hypothetical protein
MEEHEICDAIHHRRRLRFWYRGGFRMIEPYAYGVDDGGRPILRAYQVEGFSRSLDHGWKLFEIGEIKKPTTVDQTFDAPHQGYMRNDPTMTTSYCKI